MIAMKPLIDRSSFLPWRAGVAEHPLMRRGGRPARRWPAAPMVSLPSPPAPLPEGEGNDDENPTDEDPRAQRARLEAILLIAREPLSPRKLAFHANLPDGTAARTLLRRLNERYDGRGYAFRVEGVAGGYQALTRPAYAPWLRRLEVAPAEVRLSPPALETLAVVAYRQPVVRAAVEAIRGVACGEVLRQLMERDLVRIAGRGDDLGRPYLYATTRRFMQVFGLRNLDQLPHAQRLRGAGIAAGSTAGATGGDPPTPAG